MLRGGICLPVTPDVTAELNKCDQADESDRTISIVLREVIKYRPHDLFQSIVLNST